MYLRANLRNVGISLCCLSLGYDHRGRFFICMRMSGCLNNIIFLKSSFGSTKGSLASPTSAFGDFYKIGNKMRNKGSKILACVGRVVATIKPANWSGQDGLGYFQGFVRILGAGVPWCANFETSCEWYRRLRQFHNLPKHLLSVRWLSQLNLKVQYALL